MKPNFSDNINKLNYYSNELKCLNFFTIAIGLYNISHSMVIVNTVCTIELVSYLKKEGSLLSDGWFMYLSNWILLTR